jgi:hypothetical protein
VCHDQQQEIGTSGVFRRQITEATAADGTGEFSTDFNSHHVNDGTGSQIVTKWDCVVCHAEGDADTGAPDTNYHMKDGVQLKNVDGTVTSYTDGSGVYSNWSGLDAAARSDFCLSCHDSDGSTLVSDRNVANGGANPDDPGDPAYDDYTEVALNPFNDGVTNAHELDGFDGSAAPHQRIRPTGQTGAGSPGVVDVKSQFDPNTTDSHHAVLDQAYTSADLLTWADPGVKGAITGVADDGQGGAGITTGLDWTSTLECEDCHYGDPVGNKLSGHGTDTSRYMLRNANGDDAVGLYDWGTNPDTKTLICHRCHDPHVNATNFAPHHSQDSNHQVDGDNIFGIACLNCHGGGYVESFLDRGTPTTYVDGAISWGAIHGVPSTAPKEYADTPNVFVYGSALARVNNWTDLGSPSCGAIGDTMKLNNCTQHSSQSSRGQGYDRSHSRTYLGGP